MDVTNNNIKRPLVSSHFLNNVENAFMLTGQYALYLAFVLISIWCIGRLFAAFSGSPVFEPGSVKWLAVLIWGLLGIFVIMKAIFYLRQLSDYYRRVTFIICWVSFAVLVLTIIYFAPGYRISSNGLFASIAGMSESAKQSFFLLFKYYPD